MANTFTGMTNDEILASLGVTRKPSTPITPAQSGAATTAPTAASKKEEEEKENLWERIKKLAGYTAESAVSGAAEAVEGNINAVSDWQQRIQKSAMQQAAGGAAMAAAFSKNPLVDEMAAKRQEEAKEAATTPTEIRANFGDRYSQKVAEKYDTENMGFGGKLLGSVAQGLGQLAVDAAASVALPGVGGMLTSFGGAYGNSVQEAKKNGADDLEAMAYGLGVGAVNAAFERGLGGMSLGKNNSIYGKGLLDNVGKPLIEKLSKNAATKVALNTVRSALGEGLEEFVSEFGSRLVDKLTIKQDNRNFGETFNDAMYSALVGGIIGAIANTGDSIKAGKSADPKTLAEQAANQAAEAINNDPKISPSKPTENQPTNVAPQMADPNQGASGEANIGAEANVNGNNANGDGLGAANAGFTTNEGEQVKTANKTITENPNLTPSEKEMLAPGTHERISEQESVNRAQQNFYVDSDGKIVNLEYTIADLMDKDVWNSIEQDTAQLVMKELIRTARETGDYTQAQAFAKKAEEAGATEVGRSLQARKKWIAKDGDNILIEAAAVLDGMDGKTVNETLKVVGELADEYNAATKGAPATNSDAKASPASIAAMQAEAQKLIEIIRKTAKARHTTGLFSKDLGKLTERVLNEIAQRGDIEFLREFAANGIANIATDKVKPTLADSVKTIRRLSLLSKISTTMRNLVSNGVFGGFDTLSRDVSVPLDELLSKLTGTRSIAVDKSVFSEAKRKGSVDALQKSFLEVGLDVDTFGSEGKYENTSNRTFKMSGGIASKLFSTWEKFSNLAMQTPDAMAKGGVYAEIKRGLTELADKGKLKLPAPNTDGTITSPAFSEGTLVKALDRNNYGKVVGYNANDNTYVVHFKNPQTNSEANVTLPADQVISLTGKKHQAVYKDTSELIDEMAKQEALYRTFQDDTMLSRFALGGRDWLSSLNVAGIGVGDLAIPFAKTPANLASRALEYSPIGMVKSFGDMLKVVIDAKKGQLNPAAQAKAVQAFGRGFNGTMLIVASTALSALGLIKTLGNGSDEEDKNKTAYDKMAGQYGTQLNLTAALRWVSGQGAEWRDGDTLISISFLEPINAHLTTGALIAEAIKEEDMGFWEKLATGFRYSPEGAFKSILDLPVMTTFKDAAQAYEYSDAETGVGKAFDAAEQFAAGTVTSFVPNIVKGVAQGTDPIQRQSYAGDNLWEQTLNNVKASIPGLRQTVDAKKDSFGNEMQNEGGVLNFLNSTVLPGYVTHYTTPEGSEVLSKIYELTGNANIYPDRKAPNKVSTSIDGKSYKIELDTEAKDKYLTTAGNAYEEILAAVSGNKAFDKLTSEQAADILADAQNFANRQATIEAFKDQGIKVEVSDKEKVLMDMTPSQYIEYLVLGERTPIAATYKSKPEWQQYEQAIETLPTNLAIDMIYAGSEVNGKKFEAAVNAGVSLEDALAYYKALTQRTPNGEAPTAGEKSKRIRELGLSFDVLRALDIAWETKKDN